MIYKIISRTFFCIVIFLCFVISSNQTLQAKGFNYTSSVLTDEEYSVRLVRTDKNLISCAAVNRKSKPPIFMDKTFLGSGAIGFVDAYFSIKTSSRIVSVPILIGDKSMTIQAVAAGHIISLGLSEKEISDAVKKGISVNGQKLEAKNINKLYSLVSKCLATKK